MYNMNRTGPMRVERHKLQLQGYTFTYIWEPGNTNPADYASRHPDIQDSAMPSCLPRRLSTDGSSTMYTYVSVVAPFYACLVTLARAATGRWCAWGAPYAENVFVVLCIVAVC